MSDFTSITINTSSTSLTILKVQQDLVNPMRYYIKTNNAQMSVVIKSNFTEIDTTQSNFDIGTRDTYGFSTLIESRDIGGTPTDIYLASYIDWTNRKFKIGLARDSNFMLNTSSTSIDIPEMKVTYNGTNKYLNQHGINDLLFLNNKSLKVQVGSNPRVLEDNAYCNDETDYEIVGDKFYNCRESCLNVYYYYVGLGEKVSRCSKHYFYEHYTYKFTSTLNGKSEQRMDCGQNEIDVISGSISSSCNETGTCIECSAGVGVILHHNSFKHCTFSNTLTSNYGNEFIINRTASEVANPSSVAKRYCLSSCNYSNFTIIYEKTETINGAEVTKRYCTDNCAAGPETINMEPGIPFYNAVFTNSHCRKYCEAPRNFVVRDADAADIATVMVEPECRTVCNVNSNRIYRQNFVYDPNEAAVEHIFCLATCTTEDRLFTNYDGTFYECVSSCPTEKRFAQPSGIDPNYCVSNCTSAYPYIIEKNTFTGDPSTIVEGSCRSSCESNDHFKYEITPSGVYVCQNSCYSDRPFFDGSNICFAKCDDSSYPFVRRIPGVEDPLLYNSTRGLCQSSCDNAVEYKYSNLSTNSQVYCLNKCHTDKPYYGTDKVCVDKCPSSAKYVRHGEFLTVLTSDDNEGECNTGCLATEYKYEQPGDIWFCVDECPLDRPYWDSSRICLSICPTSDPYVTAPAGQEASFSVAYTLGQCDTTCDGPSKFRFNKPENTHQYYCLAVCEIPKEFFINHGSYNECVFECPGHLRFSHPTTKECLAGCPSDYPYYNQLGECTAQCDDLIFEWECNSTCKGGYNYVVDQICDIPCPKTLLGWDCSPYCPTGQPAFRNKYCGISCLQNQYLHDVQNFGLPREIGTCRSDCSDYLIDGGIFPTGNTKIYCVPACPELYLKEIRSVDEKWCVLECDMSSPWKFTVLGDKCVEDCIDIGFKYINEEYQCLDDCSFFIDDDIWCVQNCPKERPFVYEQHCVETCPNNAPKVDEFLFCVPECESFIYDQFCVTMCNSAELMEYYSSNQLLYEQKAFVHSTGLCAKACDEPGYEWIHENTNQCLAACPIPCVNGTCASPEMKLKESSNYCRSTCDQEEYSFTDLTSLECLSRCSEVRPYFVRSNKRCLVQCPLNKSFIHKRAVCVENQECDQNCEEIEFECLDKCPQTAPYLFSPKDEVFCVCSCPHFFRIKEGTVECELFCDPELGLNENEDKTGCNKCLDTGLVLLEGDCEPECPKGYVANVHGACRTCKQLGLWQNDLFECIRFRDCGRFALFDYELQTCTRCEEEGLMLEVIYPNKPKCLKTDCNGGHLVQGIPLRCFICPENWFYYGEECHLTCPENTYSNYVNFTCTQNCFEQCSDKCCVNGSCQVQQEVAACACAEGWIGKRCDIQLEASSEQVNTFATQIITRIETGQFDTSDKYIITEYYLLRSRLLFGSRLLSYSDDEVFRNVYQYVEVNKIQYKFEPKMLSIIDSLILLGFLKWETQDNSTNINLAVKLLDNVTDEIQFHLTQTNIVGDFEKIYMGKFKGVSFNFSFGTDITDESEVNVTTCTNQIKTREKLASSHKFPYKLIRFSNEVVPAITRRYSHVFNLSSSGLFEFSIFAARGVFPLNDVCKENFVDTIEQVNLGETEAQTANKLNSSGVNVFDITASFFNDKCVPYQSEDGKDLTLAERKSQLFNDPAKLCKESSLKVCEVTGFSTEGEAVCLCKGIQNSKKSSLQSFASSYPQTNFMLITCIKTFRNSEFLKNIGFYIVFLVFALSSLVSLRSMFTSDSTIHSYKRFYCMRNDLMFYKEDSMDKKKYFEACYEMRTKFIEFTMSSEIKESVFISLTEKEKRLLLECMPTIKDYSALSFDELLELDQRSTSRFALDEFMERNVIVNTFIMDSLVFPKYFRILFFMTEFNLNVTLNAFFIDDSLIENFNEAEETGLFYSVTNEATKTFWAFATTKLVMTFFKLLYRVSDRESSHLLRRMQCIEADYLKRAFNHFLLNTRLMTLIFSFLVFSFNLVCAYFVIVFCEIYKNSIEIWINGIYMGWILDYIGLGIIVPALMVAARYLSQKQPKLSFLYKLAKNIDIMAALGFN